MVNWAAAEACKRCGAHFNLGNDTLYAQAAYATSYQSAPAPAYAPATSYQTAAPYAYPTYQQMQKSTGLALASLIVGIISFLTLSFLGLGAITGIVLSIIALNKIKREPAQYGGQGMAVGGLVTSILSIVIAIPVAVIMAIAIPNVLAARMAANEASAIRVLRTLDSAEATYQATSGNGNYGTLEQLGDANLIDTTLARGSRNGYRFTVRIITEATSETPAKYEAVATPISYRRSGRRSFYVDESGIIRLSDKAGREASANDRPLGEADVRPPSAYERD
jgi:hypothetical protein